MNLARPLKVILYAAFLGLLLASYVSPLQGILESRSLILSLRADMKELEKQNAARERLVEDLETEGGVERAARERYGMIEPGEKVYIVPEQPSAVSCQQSGKGCE
ncbi:MAG TPA: septum formation initiator family protein [Rubrobacter sp.]|nr:septum formation initiator family protein [Rubrobacter sp.]